MGYIWELSPALACYLTFLVFAVGLVLGSFFNCYAWRIVHGESILKGRSHCALCGHTLSAPDLVPVVSWLCLKGRCRYCGGKISPRYVLAELTCGLGFVSILLTRGPSLQCLQFLFLFVLLFAISLVDLEDCWVPDRFLIAGAVGFLLFCLLRRDPAYLLSGLIGAAALFVPMYLLILAADKLLGKETMGGGDLKLFALLGLYLGWQQGLLLVIASCLIGLLMAAVMGKLRPGAPFPFAPAMSCAAWLCMLCGDRIIAAYLALFGL